MNGRHRVGFFVLLLIPLFWRTGLAQQVTGQDIDKILERADKLLDEAKASYEDAQAKSTVQGFIDAGFKLEEARIKYLVLQEIGSADKQRIAADRLRAVNQLSKLIHDGKVAVGGTPAEPSSPKPVDPGAIKLPPSPKDQTPNTPPPAKALVDVMKRAPVPDAAKQRDAEKLIKDLYKEQYAKKAPADKKTLARTLLDQAGKPQDDMSVLWVLCREAQEIAIQICDVDVLNGAIETAARAFDVDPISMKNIALTSVAKTAKTPDELGLAVESLFKLIDDLIRADQYDAADRAVGLATQVARKSNDSGLSTRATIRAKEVSEAKTLFAAMKNVLEAQAKNPDDPGANLEIGRFLCFVKGSWDLGVRFMAKGSDPALKVLAERELSFPAQVAERVALAEGWYELGEKDRSPLRKSQLFAHARVIYEGALIDAVGITRAKIEKRLAEMKPSDPKTNAKARQPARTGLVAWWKFDEGKGTVAGNSAGAGNQGTLSGVEWTTGRFGSALKFNGSGYVSCKPSNLPPMNSPQTISWWHNYASNPSEPQNMISLSDDGPSSTIQPGFKNGRITVWKYGGTVLVSAAPPSTNAWHHYAYVFDGKHHSLYIDGKLVDSSDVPPQTGTPTRCEFGRFGGEHHFTGLLDEIRIYNRALTEAEIQGLSASND